MDPPHSSVDPHANLHVLRTKLKEILQSVSSFSSGIAMPPIIDSSFDLTGKAAEAIQHQDSVKGLKIFKDAVRRDLDVLEKFLANPSHPRLPALSTNAPYLISVWNEALMAPPPVMAIWSTYSETGQSLKPHRRGVPKEAGAKVDVVADGGKRWIRVNTTKNSRILAEFRELDSYLTDSEDGLDEYSADEKPSLAEAELDNSILRMGRSLLAAATENPIAGTSEIPTVSLRLTRLDPHPSNTKEFDPRIAQTIEELRAIAIDVQLGERTAAELLKRAEEISNHPPRLYPTCNINLDLSILIALVADLTHAPLPTSNQDAEARFTPSAEYVEWKKKRIHALKSGSSIDGLDDLVVDLDTELVRPSRALVTQVMQEMGKGLFEEMHDRLSPILCASCTSSKVADTPLVTFWTTPEARERCLQIVAKIGGSKEKRRTEALFYTDVDRATREFWHGSRYPRGFIPLFPLHVFESDQPNASYCLPPSFDDGKPLSPFFHALAKTCRSILSQKTIPHPRAIPTCAEADDGEIQRATVTKANPRLTAHTVQSMLWGSARGWTTLTANKTSVKAILREMRATRAGLLWDRGDELGVERSHDIFGDAVSAASAVNTTTPAALWMVDPRSLAEGMRADFSTR